MREIIAVCRSSKRSRVRVAAVLDRYFWRIGDRTWRGRASNACLDRVARELRAEAKRNTAVVIHEIRSARESRIPIVRIGSRSAFSDEGVVPVVVRSPAAGGRHARSEDERSRLAIVRIAILFHDLGKATVLFQRKLRRALSRSSVREADAIRHELFSAVVWDVLFGSLDDTALIRRLREITPEDIDRACEAAVPRVRQYYNRPAAPMKLAFAELSDQVTTREGTIAFAVGMLILTHHRLPDGGSTHLRLESSAHVNSAASLESDALGIAEGTPFWHSAAWLARLRYASESLRPGGGPPGLDIALRAAMMFADHLGSALSEVQTERRLGDEHLANTKDRLPADSLSRHIERVWQRAAGCFDMLHRHRERYPALAEDQVPIDISHPEPATGAFAWQAIAAGAARALCAMREGGFFACLMAGTGTGKTRGAPTVLASAAFADPRPERRYLRMTLALGLRSLAQQSAEDYTRDLGFDREDVAVMIGQPPIRFHDEEEDPDRSAGSESLLALPDWLRIERARGGPPPAGHEHEADWLRRLSMDTDRRLPATLDRIIENARGVATSAKHLAASPIIVGTVDHLMGVASPVNARYLYQTLRVLTSDLILDEIDQYEPEDIAAIGRLVYQTAAGGRRVIVMSATLPDDVAKALYEAYRAGWREHAAASGLEDHVNVLCCGDAPGSCATNSDGRLFAEIYEDSRTATLASLEARAPLRRGKILPVCSAWEDLVAQIDAECSTLHDKTASALGDLNVSVGFVRMTRITHTAALATQLPAGVRERRLRLKLCLHSQFPRLHRAFIERELRSALTRKGRDPHANLRLFCVHHGLFERAGAALCDQLEIVVVTSPVIETGNDLDFDWAILDPSSMRAVVQAAGRVWRHRVYSSEAANVALLGRSAVVMQTGKLAKPGVETRPHSDTCVPAVDLNEFVDRQLIDLVGERTFDAIDARAILGGGQVPLRENETELRSYMVSAADANRPLGCYIRHPISRLNRHMTASRKFRRTTTRDLLYFQDGEDPNDRSWMLDLAPGTRDSSPRPARTAGLHLAGNPPADCLLFPNLSDLAWRAAPTGDEEPTLSQIRSFTDVRVPDYGRAEEGEPTMTYAEWTGFTRGDPDNLNQPFGKQAPKSMR